MKTMPKFPTIRILNDNGLQWYESEIMATKIIELGLEIETRESGLREKRIRPCLDNIANRAHRINWELTV